MARMTKWLAACCLLAFGNTAMAQENTARPIPEGFVLPGPPPTNAPAGATLPGESAAPAQSAPPPGAPAPAAPGTPPTVSGSNVATQNTVLPTAGAVQILGAGTGGKHQWPCVQRKVEHVDAGQVWPGPPLEQAADVPRTDVYFAQTYDSVGPLGAKSMSESPYNPVAPALGNAIAAATGIRFTKLPFKPDRIFPALQEKFGK